MELSPAKSRERPQQSPLGPRLIRPQTSTLSLDLAVQQATGRASTRDSQRTLYSPGPSSPMLAATSMDSSSKLGSLPEVLSSGASSPATERGQHHVYRSSSLKNSPVDNPHHSIHRSPSLSSNSSVKHPHTASSLSSLELAARSLRVQPVAKMPALLPPPDVRFESVAVSWKGLPLEAALWTFTSQELQQIVSRAIRSSAHESFIRLLPLENVDNSIPTEIERLRILKATTSSRYRFCVQRRTMLLQALHSFSTSAASQERDGGTALLSSLALQLAEVTSECDKLADELVKITEQLGSLGKLLDVHWSSALAIALRKLNGSYGKRTADLANAKERIAHLESELDDAWKEAKTMAEELDRMDAQRADDALAIANEMLRKQEEAARAQVDLEDMDEDLTEDALGLDEGTAIIHKAEVVSLHTKASSFSTTAGLAFSPPTLMKLQTQPYNIPLTVLSSPVRDKMPDGIPRAVDDEDDDKMSVISKRSTRSRVSQVEAAHRRSVRTSLGSLRMPSRKASFDENIPPVPYLPKSLVSRPSPADYRQQRSSFLSFESGKNSALSNGSTTPPMGMPPRKRVSINDIQLVDDVRPTSALQKRGSEHPYGGRRNLPLGAMDDIGVMPRTDEIAEVPWAVQRRSVDETTLPGAGAHYREHHPRLAPSIPSIWQMSEAPKTPAERVEMMMNMKNGPQKAVGAYQKLKSFTQRYSLPFDKLRHGSLGKSAKGHP